MGPSAKLALARRRELHYIGTEEEHRLVAELVSRLVRSHWQKRLAEATGRHGLPSWRAWQVERPVG
jgi:hypothetical protein